MTEPVGTGGTAIPEWTVTPGLIDTVMFAAAMWEFQRLHFDHDWARQEGLERAIVHGPLLGNYLVRTVEERLGRYELEQITWRNQAMAPVDETLTCGGTLYEIGPDGAGPAADLWITRPDGQTVISGTARLRVTEEPSQA